MPDGDTPFPDPSKQAPPPDIRLFDNAAIQRAVDEQLAALGPDDHIAVIAYADFDQARLGVVARIGDQWSFVGTLDKPWHGPLEGSAQIVWKP